ncbi:MAG: hypothetical protein HYX69_09150 [Planctomycetia bacterium]|nr:hypothetical protein [Planctomycetia bacterium]
MRHAAARVASPSDYEPSSTTDPMHDLAKIDLLLLIGLGVAIIAIAGGVRGVYAVAASSRRERNNSTTSVPAVARKSPSSTPAKRRKAA